MLVGRAVRAKGVAKFFKHREGRARHALQQQALVLDPTRGARRYTQVSARHRRSGRDAGTQAHGGETSRHSSTCRAAKLPSMALDTGIHAGMTTLGQSCL